KAFDEKRDEVKAIQAELDTAMADAEDKKSFKASADKAASMTQINLPEGASLGSAEAIDHVKELVEKERVFEKHIERGLNHKMMSGEEMKALAPREGTTFSTNVDGGVCVPPAMAVKMFGLKWAKSVGYSDYELNNICKASTMLSSSDILGGYTVPQDFRLPMLDLPTEQPHILQRATVLPAPTGELTFPKGAQTDDNEYGGMAGSWIAEGGAKSKTDTQFEQVKIATHEFAMYTQISTRLLARSAIGMENWIATRGRQVCLDAMDKAFINGDGDGKPLGILQTTGIREVKRQTAGTVDRKDTTNLKYALQPYHRGAGVYVMNDGVLQALENLEDAEGRQLFTASMANGPFDRLGGFPYINSTRSPLIGVDGDCTFVDLREYYIPMEQDVVIKRSDDFAITNNLATIVIFVAVGGELVQPRVASTLVDEITS
ncbi:phage major capsid protein, partial [Candidatus Pacearchaeota archaeon]|nr:phage major capsid protein [Candidatus Pacearchaeota archaeon]